MYSDADGNESSSNQLNEFIQKEENEIKWELTIMQKIVRARDKGIQFEVVQ